MRQKKSPVTSVGMVESLEGRRLLSAATAISLTATPTSTELGQSITVSVDVAARSGRVKGTAEILDNGTVIGSGTINKRGGISGTVDAIDNATGGNVFFNGKNVFTAQYMGHRGFLPSTSSDSDVNISMPRLVKETHGLKIRTVYSGSGAAAAAGQSVTVAYTCYVAATGAIFDSSVEENNKGNSPGTLTFTLTSDIYSSTVVPGFDEGIMGMEVGETRIIDIPSALGYGSTGDGSAVPPNSELIFVVTRTA
jgi:hypothetical protein